MRRRPVVALVLTALVAGWAGCGSDEPATSSQNEQMLNLTVRVADGKGKVARATLACDAGGTGQGSGFLASGASEHCRTARALQRLLTAQPRTDQVCTQLYGGPQTAHIDGTVAGRAVVRDLALRNGCEIADWKQAEALLAPSGIRARVAGP
jgi:hypothetical protein